MATPGARRYKILETLGEGGAGVVHRAIDTVEEREVALKVLHADVPLDLGADEFRLLASHSHPHLVQVFDYGTTQDGRAYFTMEYCRGEDVVSYVRRQLPPLPDLAADRRLGMILCQIVETLDYIHGRRLLHRDVKPSNIVVVERDGQPVAKLIDFGLARRTRAVGSLRHGDFSDVSHEDSISGTVEYLSPERLRGEPGDPGADLYSLGVILYEVFCGKPPFAGASAGEVVRGHLERAPPDLDSLPDSYRGLITKLLEKTPERRPRSAAEVFALLPDLPGREARRDRLLPAFSSVLVGREGILKTLEARAAAARRGRGHTTLFKASTGSGKSRLLREHEVRLQLAGETVYREVCRETGEHPGRLLQRILARLVADLPANAPQEQALSALQTELVGDRPRPGGDEKALQEGFFYRFSNALLALAAERPFALLVDDLQWADTLSLECLTYLARCLERRGACHVSLILTCRSDDEADHVLIGALEEKCRGLASFEIVGLPALTVEDVRSYLAQILGSPESFPEEFPRSLVVATGGNPFFIEEYLKLRIQLGGVERTASGWKVDARKELPVPSSMEEVARKRLRQLRGFRRQLLEWAAVLAEPFGAAELTRLIRTVGCDDDSESGESRLVERVEAELTSCLLDQTLRREGESYTFAHAAIEQALYEILELEQRRRRHGLTADWLLARGDPEEDDRLEQVARHLYFSDEPVRARVFLRRAGERALAAGALREAATHISRALEVSDDSAERFEMLLVREEVWSRLGKPRERLADIRRLGELSSALGDSRWQCEAAAREALYLDSQGEKRQALEKLEEALDLAAGEEAMRARLLSRGGMLRFYLSEFEGGMDSLTEAVSIARRLQDREQEAECLQLVGLGHYLQGNYDPAVVEIEGALAIRRELGDDQRVGALESNLGLIQFDRGLLEAAKERFQDSLKTFSRIGHRRGEAVNLLNLGLVYSEMGLLERAIGFISEALDIRRELGDRHGEGADIGNLGAAWLRVGLFERAAPLLEQALSIARESENHQSESVNECRLGLVAMQRGEPEKAQDRFEKSLEMARRAGGAFHKLLPLTSLARLHLDGDPGKSLDLLEEARAMAVKADMRSWRIECRALEAMAFLALGRLDDGEEASRDAVAELERFPGLLDRSQEVWFARYRVLESLRRRGRADGGGEGDVEGALRRAYTLLREKADAFNDPELRAAFLDNIPVHREINRRHEEMQRRIRREASRRERSFYEIAKSIHSILDLDLLLDRLLELAIESTHAEKGLILLRDRDGNLITRAARGMARESVEDATDICKSVIAQVAGGGEPVLATDASTDDRFRERRSVISFHIRTLMCVPLEVRDEVVGAVYVDGRGSASFSAEDLDYLVSFAHLAAIAVENARLLGRLKAENLSLRREVESGSGFKGLLGRSEAMEKVKRLMEKVASTSASIFLSGDTGTGKAVIARAIHYASERRSRPFVTVDCGALPENLLESELFGHKRGAFSGAISDRIGLIEEAEGGTLFLDEVTNTTLDLQAKLLRVLQEGEIRRVGENEVRKVDVRIIAATNADIRRAVDDGKFREDLFYRLNVVPIEVPPLRERRDDIPHLAMHFLKRSCERAGRAASSFTAEAMRLLERMPWKGNVRELENLVEKAVVLAERHPIDASFLASLFPGVPAGEGTQVAEAPAPGMKPSSSDETTNLSLEEFDQRWRDAERAYLTDLVERSSWNLSAAARLAAVRNRNTLISRLKKHGIRRPE